MKNIDDENVYWIRGEAQFNCLMSARRMAIIGQLANAGPISIRELAKLIGAKPSALYHHIEQMVAVGLVEEAGSRTVNRRREQLYQTPGSVVRYGLKIGDPEALETFKRLSAVQCRQAERDFARGLESGEVVGEGPGKNAWIFRLVGSPDAAAMAKINSHIEAIADLFWQSAGEDNPLIVMSAVMAPVPQQSSED